MKRLFDILLALCALPAVIVLCVPCILAIRMESPGSGLFCQVRVGRKQRPFMLYKLRTMSTDTGDRASHEVAPSQITRTGHFLRRTKLDELPQIWNVLMGDMSFVGPRPCLPNQTELVAERAGRDVYDIRPGITGPAQLAGIDMSTPRQLAIADAEYLKTRSLTGDLRLILATATGGGRGDAVKGT